MKAIAVFQFYFPYVLPRADDWPTEHIGFEFRDYAVGLHPRNPDEELFPHEIDRTLSTMSLTLSRISLPMGLTSLTVRERCHDRMEVRVHGELDSPGDAKRDDIQEEFRSVAVSACNIFLNHCRVAARSPFVVGVERHYRIEDGRYYVLTPHTITWFNGDDGSFLPAYAGDVNGVASSGGRILSRRASFAEKRYHLLTEYLSGRSFMNEDFPNFEFIEKTYRTRNNLAHKGRLCFDNAGTVIEVDQRLATHFLSASAAAINWVTGL